MDLWDNQCMVEEDTSPKIKMLLDGQNLIMFFVKDGIAYGCPEESRITYARIRHPNKEDSDLAEARFAAINLFDALVGKVTENLFTKKDMKKIKIVTQEKCTAMLEKELKKKGKKPHPKSSIHKIEKDQEDDRRPLRKED